MIRFGLIISFFYSSFLLIFLSSSSALALELEYLNQYVLPHKLNYKKSIVGGLSGLYLDWPNLYAVSDDRGNINEPRVYEFSLTIREKEFKVEPQNVIFLTVNESSLSHKSTQSKARLFSKVLDLEGISMAPWGDFLLVNEGDCNHKPRVSPQLFSAKKDGIIQKDFEVPSAFLPEPSGVQKTGVQNNLAFESVAMSPNGKEWMVAAEGPLYQDPKTFVRWIQYTMPEAWVLKPGKEYRYPMEIPKGESMQLMAGNSEIHYIDESRLLVLERGVQVGPQGLKISVQIYETDLASAGKEGLLTKKRILDLADLKDKIGKTENFEGITLGPKLSDGRRSLILVSDDNFMRNQRTQFLLFAIKE